MDPCPFVRLTVGNLALKIPVASKPARSVVHPSSSPCFCKIKLKNFPLQSAIVPFIAPDTNSPDSQVQPIAATFHLNKADLDKLAGKSIFAKKLCLKISIYTGRTGTTCGVNSGRLLGEVSVPLDLAGTAAKATVFHNGWITVGKEAKGSSAQFHLNVKAEPDPRFVFQFDGEPECSPQVFQIQGNISQPVFTCKFSFRNTGDRNHRSRWIVEYQIDGFQFHSLSSMIYTHNGFASFTGDLEEYCNQYVDKDALLYLILANELLHVLYPNIITIAEDATYYPGLCEPTSQGGLGFDYFVNLSAPEMWSTFLESVPDHEWSMTKIVNTLISKKEYADKMLLYAENHNQSISGRRSFAEILFGEVDEHSQHYKQSLLRGSSLHKMIRLITLTIGGRAYLNFMGNEFGHPKGVEFPTSSNDFSYSPASRQWNLLAKDGVYSDLFAFDKDMMKLDENERVLSRRFPNIHHVNDSSMVISYIRGPLLFIFNFHPSDSYDSYRVGVEEAGEYQLILNTDEIKYAGRGILKEDQYFQKTMSARVDGMRNCMEVTLPSRTAQVYKLKRILRI